MRSINLADFIEGNLPQILQSWEDFAGGLPPLAEADRAARRDHAHAMLLGIACDMRSPQSERDRFDKSTGLQAGHAGGLNTAAAAHAVDRFREQLTTNQVLAEFRAIRASVLQKWSGEVPSGTGAVEQVTRFNEAVDQAIAVSVQRHCAKTEEARAMILGILAHDLRNPLNALHFGMQSLVRVAEAGSPVQQIADVALRSVERMDTLIRDLLAFTVLELGHGLPINPQAVDLGQLADKAADEVRAAYPGRRVVCPQDVQIEGEWDPARMQQLLVNLLSNALRYGDPHGDVTLTAQQVDGSVVLEVHNHGPAIPDAVRRSMFQPLSGARLLNDEDSGASSGAGLGLYIAREIAVAHGGTLTLHSTDDAGTTFTARLPCRPAGGAARLM